MNEPSKRSERFGDTPRDKPRADRVEHANLDRPGARAHPRARSGSHAMTAGAASWRMR